MLLDIMLPRLDGWQVCREVRKFSDKPIIMLTAKGETFVRFSVSSSVRTTMSSSPSTQRKLWRESRRF